MTVIAFNCVALVFCAVCLVPFLDGGCVLEHSLQPFGSCQYATCLIVPGEQPAVPES